METLSNKPKVSNKLSAILQKHSVVFTEGLGTFTGEKVSVLDGCILWVSRAIVPPPGRQTVRAS